MPLKAAHETVRPIGVRRGDPKFDGCRVDDGARAFREPPAVTPRRWRCG